LPPLLLSRKPLHYVDEEHKIRGEKKKKAKTLIGDLFSDADSLFECRYGWCARTDENMGHRQTKKD